MIVNIEVFGCQRIILFQNWVYKNNIANLPT